jgi:hypothetical protein
VPGTLAALGVPGALDASGTPVGGGEFRARDIGRAYSTSRASVALAISAIRSR